MSGWKLYYDGVPVAQGISDTAKETIAREIDDTLRDGGTGWLHLGPEMDAGTASLYLHPGVGIAFVSLEHRVEVGAPGIDTPVVRHT